MTNELQRCPDCGAVWTDGVTCQDHFYQMLFWETENPDFDVHHLMVLCYHLQHPGLYSPEGLRGAADLLGDFLERGLTPADIRRRDRTSLDSGKRKFKIKGTSEAHGAYEHPVQWPMVAGDVVAGGVDRYCEHVKAWAGSLYETLKSTGNLTVR